MQSIGKIVPQNIMYDYFGCVNDLMYKETNKQENKRA